jgi:hypothetical protein
VTGSSAVPAGAPAYVVHSPAGLVRQTAFLLAYPVVIGLALGLLKGTWWIGPVVLVAVLALSVSSLRAAWTRLRADRESISLSFTHRPVSTTGRLPGTTRRLVAWPWVHRVEVDTATETVRVVVRADAPLPPWEHGRVIDTRDPESGPVLERRVPGVDAAALHRLVASVSPTTVVVTR